MDSLNYRRLGMGNAVINSKEILEKTGISRATLNNYISCGIVSKPEVLPPEAGSAEAPRIGYFPDGTLERIAEIQRLKREGWSMTRITEHYTATHTMEAGVAPEPAALSSSRTAGQAETSRSLMQRLSVEEIAHPAYMVNYNFELLWFNPAARSDLLGNFDHLPSETESRNVFQYLLHDGRVAGREDLLGFHFGIARQRAPKSNFLSLCREVPRANLGMLERLYNEAEPPESRLIAQTVIPGKIPGATPICLYAVQFREGILFVYAPMDNGSDDLLTLLSRRDLVIRDLVRKRLPVLTHVAVLVADLQQSTKICSELPPEEYFELINQIWSTVDPIFRRHYGTYGKHAGDGMVYYFFPQPDCSYVWNSVRAAHEMREAMRKLSKDWQLRKGWSNELYLNAGLNEGQEWLGTFQSATHVEFTVLGDTINHAARLSDFARYGSVWATKNLIGKLTQEEKSRVKYGVRRKGSDGQDLFVTSSFATAENLQDQSIGRNDKLKDIALLPVTEIVEIAESPGG